MCHPPRLFADQIPLALRQDAGYVAAEITVAARRIAKEFGGDQVATVGVIELDPGLVNVIARKARLTVDLRNTDEALLCEAEARMADAVADLAASEGVEITSKRLARFKPVAFDLGVISLVEGAARRVNHDVT